jgi:predicted permease
MHGLVADLRFAARQLIRRPGFTAIAILTLALGTGASIAVFSVVDGVLLRPLPFPESGRLLALCETHPSVEGFCIASPPDVEDWAVRSRTVASFGLGRGWPFTMQRDGDTGAVSGGLATPGLFATLRATPALGRLFRADDVTPAGRHVVVLSDELWRTRFGADTRVVGASVRLDGERYEVVGVLRPGADVPQLEHVRLWVPVPFDPRSEENRRWRGFVAIGRMAQGASIDAAQAELDVIQRSLAGRFPETNREWGVKAVPLLDSVVGGVRPTLLVFLGAVAILLLVACANVASLMVGRGAARSRELAVRAALGARPGRLFRLIATESVLLSVAGGAGGVLVALWATDAFLSLMPSGLPRLREVALDARVLGFALGMTLAVALATGVVPALRAARLDLAEAVKVGYQPSIWRRAGGLRGSLVVAEVALAFVLAVGAGLLARSFASLLRWEAGFDRTHLLTFWTYASTGKYQDARSVAALFGRIEDELGGIPSVTSVGMASSGPLFGGEETGEFLLEDRATPPTSLVVARWYDMSPGFFRTPGVPLRRGRLFTEADRAGAPPVALLNETASYRWFAGQDPVGRRVRLKDTDVSLEIVGVVADVPPFVPGKPAQPEVYWPFQQSPRWASHFVLRTRGDPLAIARTVEARLREVDPDLSPARVATMDDLVAAKLARPWFNMLLIGAFAALALALTTVGVYGVVSAAVAGRTREIGVRVALGASSGRVVRMVIREGMLLAAGGIAIGLVAAAALSRLVVSLLFGVRPTDPATYATIALVLAAVTALACYVPARRASRVQPIEALRAE